MTPASVYKYIIYISYIYKTPPPPPDSEAPPAALKGEGPAFFFLGRSCRRCVWSLRRLKPLRPAPWPGIPQQPRTSSPGVDGAGGRKREGEREGERGRGPCGQAVQTQPPAHQITG